MSSHHLRALVRDVYVNRRNDGSSCSLCNSTDAVNGTTAATTTTATEGFGFDYNAQHFSSRSGHVESRSGQDAATLVLFILFVSFRYVVGCIFFFDIFQRNDGFVCIVI
jgi:hypothetical protein